MHAMDRAQVNRLKQRILAAVSLTRRQEHMMEEVLELVQRDVKSKIEVLSSQMEAANRETNAKMDLLLECLAAQQGRSQHLAQKPAQAAAKQVPRSQNGEHAACIEQCAAVNGTNAAVNGTKEVKVWI